MEIRSILFMFLLTMLACVKTIYCSSSPIRCNLKWIPLPTNGTLTADTVPVHVDDLYIARIIRNGTSCIGQFDGNNIAHFPGSEGELSGIELLTNPSGCNVNFDYIAIGESNEDWWVSVGSTTYIGRAIGGVGEYADKWVAGKFTDSAVQLLIELPNAVLNKRTFQVLQSTSPGLNFEVTNFVFDTSEESDQADVAGIEIIHNNSPASIVQRVVHSKNVTEIYRTTITKNFVATRTTTVKKKIVFWTKTTTTTQTYTDETQETTEHKESTIVTISKEILVPPETSVEICSEIRMKEESEVPYTAIGRYSAPGLTGEEVLRILIEDDIIDGNIVGDEVHTTVTGTFAYKLALTTNFKINPIGSNEGCWLSSGTKNGSRQIGF